VTLRPGIRALLRRFLVWRVGLRWYTVVLIGPAVLVLVALALHVVSGGATPDFGHPFARQIVGDDSISLWAILPLFFAIGVLSNVRRSAGADTRSCGCRIATARWSAAS
jgi:hypothetical protein